MKFITVIILLIIINKNYTQNLVLNPSFEEYIECPTSISQLSKCKHWSIPTIATTDYFHSCSNIFSSTQPINAIGVQKARTGDGYIGIIAYQKKTAYRELAQCRLASPLKANRYYKVSYYVSAAEASKYFTHSFGVYFSKDSISQPSFHFRIKDKRFLIKGMNKEIITNKDEWILISGIYKAKGGENYIIIGNVNTHLSQGKIETNRENKIYLKEKVSYYYIDDVSVILADNKRDTTFDKEAIISNNEIEIGKSLVISNTNNLFHNNSSDFLDIKTIVKNMKHDENFVAGVGVLNYFSNFMKQNPSTHIEVRVYKNSEDEPNELTKERTLQIIKYLKKRKVNKKQMIPVNEVLYNKNKTGLVEVRITKK